MAKAKTKKPSKSAAIREALQATPDKSAADIAKELKVTAALDGRLLVEQLSQPS